jgi:hypothetical protein
MTPPSRQNRHGRNHASLLRFLLPLVVLLIGVTPLTATALPIYESATAASPGLRGDSPEERMNVTQLQSLGVKFYCHVCEDGSKPVTTGSIGGYLAELTEYTKSEIIGAIVKLEDESDFPDSFDLTTSDVLGKTQIHISDLPGDFAGDLSVTLAGGWYALVFAATGIRDENAAIMPGVNGEIGDPLYFFGEPTGTANGFRYLDGGGLNAIRMFVDSDPAAPVPEPSTLLLLGSGLAGLGGVAWRQHRRN